MISGHDSTIAPLLIVFKQFDNKWPPFASNVIVELYKSKAGDKAATANDDHYVRMIYNNKVLRLPECQATAVENGTLCPLNSFLELTQKMIPKNFSAECQE